VGVKAFLDVAAESPAGVNSALYDSNYIEGVVVPRAIREFERKSKFRVNRVQMSSYPDGAYAPAVTAGGIGAFGGKGGTYTETGTGLTVPYQIESPYPYWANEFPAFGHFVLKQGPVLQVQRIRLMLGVNNPVLNPVPTDWYRVDPESRQVWLVPVNGQSITLTAAGLAGIAVLQMGFGNQGYLPSFIAVDYLAGLDDAWQSDPQWSDLELCLEQSAALQVLDDIQEAFDAGTLSVSTSGEVINQQIAWSRFEKRRLGLQQKIAEFMQTLTEDVGTAPAMSSI